MLFVSKNKIKIYFLVGAILILIIASFKLLNLKIKEEPLKNVSKEYEQSQEKEELKDSKEDYKETNENENSSSENIDNNINENIIWQIEIPAISLKADIRDGTDTETLNKYVGHFEDTGVDVRKYWTSST